MRRFDKTKNILKANILAEQRYLESKGLIKEVTDNYDDTANRAIKYGINQFGDEDLHDLKKEINTSEDNLNDPLFSHGVHFKSEYARKDIPRPRVIIPFAIEGQKTIWYRYKDDKNKKEHTMSLDTFLNYYELKSKYK